MNLDPLFDFVSLLRKRGIPVACFCGGIYFLSMGVRMARLARASRTWLTASGRVREAGIATSDFEGPVYGAALVYEYEVGGRKYSGSRITLYDAPSSNRTQAESLLARYPVGSDHPVYYDPDKPEFAVLQPGATLWHYLPFLGAASLIANSVLWNFYPALTRRVIELLH